ncbi:MAG: DUF6089 family protein [Saprospiraceae bacterium]
MEKMSYTLLMLMILLLPLGSLAQQKWEGTLLLGGANYQGDLVPTIYPYPKETNLAFGVMGRYYFNPQWAMRMSVMYGKLSGNDANFERADFSQKRRFSFESQLMEAALLFEWEPFGNWRYRHDSIKFKKIISPYIFSGGAWGMSDPKVRFADFQNGEAPPGVQKDRAVEYPLQHFGVPIGGGIKVDVSRKVLLGVDGGMRLTFTDYIDGVSQSAGPKYRDFYVFAGATLTVRLDPNDEDEDGIPDKRDRCPKIAGNITAQGCPDQDGDGVENSDDLCPDQHGVKILGGCPDSDNDGIADHDDRCPGAWGPECTTGCPDMDEDCISDGLDDCPTECGMGYANGCPDTDEDKIRDKDDWCPLLAGEAWKGGCPLMDTTGDGVIDEKSIFAEPVIKANWNPIWQKIALPHQVLRAVRKGMLIPGYQEP